MDTTTTRAWLLLLCLTTIFLPSAHAGWLSDLKDSSKQALNKLLKDDEKPTIPLTPLTAADVADYPAHYRFNRVIETIHQSPLFFLETGDKSKPALVLVHGLGEAASKDWLQVIPALEKDYHVFALDLPGFGLSKGVYFEYSPAQYSETLNWFIDQHVSKGSADKPIVIGHSMGGAVSLYFAATFGHQLKKLILVDAAGILERTTFIKHLSEIKLDKEWMSDSSRRLAARAE
ncbi:MAG: putative alpha/beta-fold hydrolase, partial [Phenylobacterium sp.]